MNIVFESTKIKNLELRNRFVRSATQEGKSNNDGSCSDRLIDLYKDLAEGGVGLIITSHSYVLRNGQASPRQIGVYDDSLIPGLKKLAGEVHRSGTSIILQLAHAGIFSHIKSTGSPAKGPSSVSGLTAELPQEMTIEDIEEVIAAFGKAAARAKKAGFDGVQIHGAHGYLLSQFLSPAFNKRGDNYGSSPENRARIILDVIENIRDNVGEDYPVLLKMNSRDFFDEGLEVEEALEAARMFEEKGIDAIELSGGTIVSKKYIPPWPGINSEEMEAYFKDKALLFKKSLNVPLILVGGNRSFNVAGDIIASGTADYISMSRPFVREPDLIKRWESGDHKKSECISCNQCLGASWKEEGILCVPLRNRLESADKE